MQLDTFLKLGSLAFGVAQDEKVRELAGLIHNGAKRRGVFAPWPGPGQVPSSAAGGEGNSANQNKSSAKPPGAKGAAIPFAPANSAATPGNSQIPGPLNKYLTANNAKKALNMAGEVMNLLVK